MRHEHEPCGDERFATAIAATAFAIHMLEESAKKRREGSESSRPARSASSRRRPSGQDHRASSIARPASSSKADDHMQRGKVRKERKADAWEKAAMENIKKRYGIMESEILAWENEMKTRAKVRMEKKKIELELRKDRNTQHYRMKIARIQHIADGEREQGKEKRKHEESLVKKRSEKIKAAREAPIICCFCF